MLTGIDFRMKRNKGLYLSVAIFIGILMLANCFLLYQNSSIKRANRELLLQNDSLQAVNINLVNFADSISRDKTPGAQSRKLMFR
jgi:hypothetical protein